MEALKYKAQPKKSFKMAAGKKGVIPAAKLTLDYPLYACDFDPNSADGEVRLVVGGGGGAGKNGIGNRIVSTFRRSFKNGLRNAVVHQRMALTGYYRLR